jgi:hypothetical protein
MAIFNSYVKLPEGIVDLPVDIHITYLNWRYLPYIFGLFLRPNFQGISPENMVLYGTNVPPFYDPEIPID